MVYGSKIAEIICIRKRVIVAGEAWAKGKATYDATIRTLLWHWQFISDKKPLPVRLQNLAVAYCHQFFKEMMDVEILLPTNEKAQPFTIRPLSDKEFISTKMRGFRAVLQKLLGQIVCMLAALIQKLKRSASRHRRS